MRVLIDVDVMLDLNLGREPWRADADAIWDACIDGRVDLLVPSASLSTIYHLIRKAAGRAKALQAVQTWARVGTVVPVDRTTVLMALFGAAGDYEDNVRAACALQAGADALVTRDPKGFAGAPIPVLDPPALVARLTPPGPTDPARP